MNKKIKSILILILLFVFIDISTIVKSDTTFGLDVKRANHENDIVYILIYRVPYAHIPATDYNGIIKYDTSAFTYDGGNELNIYGDTNDSILPYENSRITENSQTGELTLNLNNIPGVEEYSYFETEGAAPQTLCIPFLKKDGFDNTKQYEFIYMPDNYGKLRIIVNFDENGNVEVINRSNNFSYKSIEEYYHLDGSKEIDNDISITDENVNSTKNDQKINNEQSKEYKEKNNQNEFIYYIIFVITLVIICGLFIIVITKKMKNIERGNIYHE